MSQRSSVLNAEGPTATVLFKVTRFRWFVHHLGDKALNAHLWAEDASLGKVVAGDRHVTAIIGVFGVHVKVGCAHAVLVVSRL